ncbi:UDP-N-acetylmuramate--L-alanine ligase [Nocardioides sp. GY 10113]|uniref:UDP-N-acetylmuramate--L-alanine ligase n=1 Tax=Nocardioides sp. GY 10113 TaxID=2569761 RepID=UPI0010A76253|nr:UDP-N-acetylmuramate--L-alanine ligase [Nocardioides sp. GY 10113]TIC88639.1 UDP-N-acetylmuramate--L-alanine ligase [Nocardioides sp. GY 10113]
MRLPVPDSIDPAEELGRVHFVGIGGAGLSGIARIMARRGIPVTGSDDNDTAFLGSLRELDVPITLGYAAEHVGDADTLVVTTAAREDNPEVLEARSRGLRLLPRSAGLASVMHGQRVLAVAGTHGKTTTTSLLSVALIHAGADPSYAVGGVLNATGRNADLGAGGYFVAEADESDGAFLVYDTHAAIVLNVDADHLDVWGTPEAYAAAFEEFADGIDPEGFLICAVDDAGGAALADRQRSAGRRVVTVAVDAPADLRAVDLRVVGGGTTFRVERDGTALGEVALRIPGRHYVVDALAALAMGLEIGLPFADLAAGLGTFVGTGRRMELKGAVETGPGTGEIRVYDSYAHHPSEIRGDLEAARALAGDGGRVVACFQPHLVSRTRLFGAGMGEELGAADEVVVLDVYVAREDPDPAVTGALVAAAVPLPADRVAFVPDRADAVPELLARARPGDVVLTLGAGDVTQLAPILVDALRERYADA